MKDQRYRGDIYTEGASTRRGDIHDRGGEHRHGGTKHTERDITHGGCTHKYVYVGCGHLLYNAMRTWLCALPTSYAMPAEGIMMKNEGIKLR